jgi:signal transduction histidine kinase
MTTSESTPGLVEQVRTLGARSPLPMVATHGPKHVVRYINPAFCTLLGDDAEAFVGSALAMLFRAPLQSEDREALALLDLVYASGTPEFGVDFVRGAGGDLLQLRCSVWPIDGSDEAPGGLLLQVSPPIGARRRVQIAPEDELLDVNRRLLVASLKAQEQVAIELRLRSQAEAALTSRDEFMSIAAHELRTPVTGIKISAQLALRTLEDASSPDSESVVQCLHGIVAGANRLVSLMNDLMDVSRMRSGDLFLRLAQIDFAALVRTVALRHAVLGGARHTVCIQAPLTPLVVAGDAGRLDQILDNLLSNAVKYSPAGGEIGVDLRVDLDGIVLRLADEGIGLTPGEQEHIFEPFGRAANAIVHELPGLGLGLHICRQIAAAHGGRMWAESSGEGQGMTVTLWLPPVHAS